MKELSNYNLDISALLQDLFDEAYDLIQIVQPDGTLLFVNKAWSSLLGYPLDQIIGQSVYLFVDEQDRRRFTEYRQDVIAGRNSGTSMIFNLRKQNGQLMHVEGSLSVKCADGVPIYTRGIFRDITLRVQNETQLQRLHEELNEREQNFRGLLHNAPDAVIVIDQNSLITFWNPKAEDLFGWTANEVLHKNLSLFIIPEQFREAHNQGMIRFLQTGETRVLNKTIEITARKKNGDEFYVALTISATQQGGKPAFIAFLRDVSEQKQNQAELENKTRQLERSNAYLEDFAHVASHDLKEPLRKIIVFSGWLKGSLKSYVTEQDHKYFDRLETSARRMQLLVDDLLEFSQVSDKEPELETIDLNEKVKKVLQDLELLIEEKNARIIVAELPSIKGNRRQLQQLISNLLNNALKYSRPQVTPCITINYAIVRGTDLNNGELKSREEDFFHLLTFQDNGIGFEQSYAEKIFKVFSRLHGKAEYGGSGVGLAIAKKVATNHDGYIWATGKLNEGATFYFALPV